MERKYRLQEKHKITLCRKKISITNYFLLEFYLFITYISNKIHIFQIKVLEQQKELYFI